MSAPLTPEEYRLIEPLLRLIDKGPKTSVFVKSCCCQEEKSQLESLLNRWLINQNLTHCIALISEEQDELKLVLQGNFEEQMYFSLAEYALCYPVWMRLKESRIGQIHLFSPYSLESLAIASTRVNFGAKPKEGVFLIRNYQRSDKEYAFCVRHKASIDTEAE